MQPFDYNEDVYYSLLKARYMSLQLPKLALLQTTEDVWKFWSIPLQSDLFFYFDR